MKQSKYNRLYSECTQRAKTVNQFLNLGKLSLDKFIEYRQSEWQAIESQFCESDTKKLRELLFARFHTYIDCNYDVFFANRLEYKDNALYVQNTGIVFYVIE